MVEVRVYRKRLLRLIKNKILMNVKNILKCIENYKNENKGNFDV